MHIPAKKWQKQSPPKKILAIRLQAMGDLVITLPYLQQLKKQLPAGTVMDLLTREEVASIPRSIYLFDQVISIRGGRNVKKQFLWSIRLLPKLIARGYDVVIDLQNNIISKTIAKIIHPIAWSLFDRFSPVPAGERTRLTIEGIGLGACFAETGFAFRSVRSGLDILHQHGWDGHKNLVILNPAGAFVSRNWPLENYVSFAKMWISEQPNTQFVIMGTGLIASKTAYLKNALAGDLIDIVNLTSPVEAFSIVQHARFMLSEDSGLMHMAWVSGIPTLALFGSTRSDWAQPLGRHSFFLDSADLPCGQCMQEICKYGDTHCLSRFTPQIVFSKAMVLWQGLFKLPWTALDQDRII